MLNINDEAISRINDFVEFIGFYFGKHTDVYSLYFYMQDIISADYNKNKRITNINIRSEVLSRFYPYYNSLSGTDKINKNNNFRNKKYRANKCSLLLYIFGKNPYYISITDRILFFEDLNILFKNNIAEINNIKNHITNILDKIKTSKRDMVINLTFNKIKNTIDNESDIIKKSNYIYNTINNNINITSTGKILSTIKSNTRKKKYNPERISLEKLKKNWIAKYLIKNNISYCNLYMLINHNENLKKGKLNNEDILCTLHSIVNDINVINLTEILSDKINIPVELALRMNNTIKEISGPSYYELIIKQLSQSKDRISSYLNNYLNKQYPLIKQISLNEKY